MKKLYFLSLLLLTTLSGKQIIAHTEKIENRYNYSLCELTTQEIMLLKHTMYNQTVDHSVATLIDTIIKNRENEGKSVFVSLGLVKEIKLIKNAMKNLLKTDDLLLESYRSIALETMLVQKRWDRINSIDFEVSDTLETIQNKIEQKMGICKEDQTIDGHQPLTLRYIVKKLRTYRNSIKSFRNKDIWIPGVHIERRIH